MLELGAKPQNQNRSIFPPSHAESRSGGVGGGVPGETESGTGSGGGSGASRHPAPGGPGHPTERSGTDTTPFPGDYSFRLTASLGSGRTHPGGRDGRFGGPDTDQAPLDTVTDPHTGDRTKNGSSLSFASGSVLFCHPPTPVSPHAHLFSLGKWEVFASRWFATSRPPSGGKGSGPEH